MSRPAGAIVAWAAVLATLSCQTVADPFPPQSAVNVTITNTNVESQFFPLPNPQITIWTVDEISIHDLTDFNGKFDFLLASPCTYQLNALAPLALASACKTSGLSLKPGTASQGIVRIRISDLELRAAARPDLNPTADPDGDGIPNSSDNCPIIYNPDQKNSNEADEIIKVGDACSILDASGKPTIADQDLDGIKDTADNCVYYANPLVGDETTPPDQNRDGIGDACERIAPVILPAAGLTIECSVTFKPVASKVTTFRMDFGRTGVLTCDQGFTGCSLDPSALKLEKLGTTDAYDCHMVP